VNLAALPHRVYETLGVRLPPRAAAALDGLVPGFADGWGGPFNGQERRREIFEQVVAALAPQAIVETGTFRGTTTAFLATRAPVRTVEANPRQFHYATRRFRGDDRVAVSRGDSVAFLRRLRDDPAFPKERVFFYLDAHWEESLPLRDEVHVVGEGWRDSAVMVDDFAVPGEPGYGFDDYGPGRRLSIEYLDGVLDPFEIFWPAAPASAETGARRGCVVVATRGTVADALLGLPSLRAHDA
jgi:hypothetical protein